MSERRTFRVFHGEVGPQDPNALMVEAISEEGAAESASTRYSAPRSELVAEQVRTLVMTGTLPVRFQLPETALATRRSAALAFRTIFGVWPDTVELWPVFGGCSKCGQAIFDDEEFHDLGFGDGQVHADCEAETVVIAGPAPLAAGTCDPGGAGS